MDSEQNSTTASPSGKRSRDPEDEIYIDNLHSHKRYLSEIMASSLNGLTVGDSLPETIMDSPARTETPFYPRDEMLWQFSPMAEDQDDSRCCETSVNNCSPQSESLTTSPASPSRYQKPPIGSAAAPCSSHSNLASTACSQPGHRGSDSERRFPSSPSDICHSADLRRAALLRSVQMRTHPSGPSSSELPDRPGQEHASNVEVECGPLSYMKSLAIERYDQIDLCSSMAVSETESDKEKPCKELRANTDEKEERGD